VQNTSTMDMYAKSSTGFAKGFEKVMPQASRRIYMVH